MNRIFGDSMTRLDEIKEREAKATKGPWSTDKRGGGIVRGAKVYEYANGNGTRQLAMTMGHDDLDSVESAANAEFIAEGRSDIPWLIAEVERLRGLIASAEKSASWGYEGEYQCCPWCDNSGDNRTAKFDSDWRPHKASCLAFTPDGDVK